MHIADCPFCGKGALLHQGNDSRGSMGADPSHVRVECSECGAQTKNFYEYYDDPPKEKALAAWNRRA